MMPRGGPGKKRGPRPDLVERNKTSAKHGYHKTKTYKVWSSMRERCLNKKHKNYNDYGGRGIYICPRWLDKEKGFLHFLSDMGDKPDGYQIDRIDNDGGYSPENCRWVTSKENNRNRRSNKLITYNGISKCVAEWADFLGIDRKTLQMRLNAWDVKKSFETPYTKRKIK